MTFSTKILSFELVYMLLEFTTLTRTKVHAAPGEEPTVDIFAKN